MEELSAVVERMPKMELIKAAVAPAEELKLSNLELERAWLKRVGVGRRMSHLVIDPRLVPSECQVWLERWHEGASMILAGTPGAGKTVAAVYCLRMIYRDRRRMQTTFRGVLYVKARALYRAVFERDLALLRRARECDALVIDEWGAAYDSEWPLAEIDGIIDDRWEDRRATIITTNKHPTDGDGCIKGMAPRAYDRLCDEPGPGVVLIDRASLRG
jgi:hypothetical protein